LIRREIDGVWYFCQDVNEDDQGKAKENRYRIRNNVFTGFWRQMETYLEQHPDETLPEWIPSIKD
jgi:hypothetical protein